MSAFPSFEHSGKKNDELPFSSIQQQKKKKVGSLLGLCVRSHVCDGIPCGNESVYKNKSTRTPGATRRGARGPRVVYARYVTYHLFCQCLCAGLCILPMYARGIAFFAVQCENHTKSTTIRAEWQKTTQARRGFPLSYPIKHALHPTRRAQGKEEQRQDTT